ncbi:MAG TPA: hypothetical protein VFX84_00795 [Candidatus Saccharimonadales bacterium]|nr:hypothetical protein [Candidatus Saccharimonadales bacterium]
MSEGIGIDRNMTCPQTGEVCEWAVYCSLKKQMIEKGRVDDDPIMDLLIDRLPAEELGEVGNVGYCAEKMIRALVKTAEVPDETDSTELTRADMDFMARNDRGNF